MKTIKLFCLFSVLMTASSFAQVKTYLLSLANPNQQIEVKANEVVQVLFHNGVTRFDFMANGVVNSFKMNEFPSNVAELKLPVIAGPLTMTVYAEIFSPSQNAVFTIKKTVQTDTLTPTAAVVIPSDANGPANIVLESSTNLVNWTAALPGTYGKSVQTRYFRVRAELLE